jgi:hypothetical protein
MLLTIYIILQGIAILCLLLGMISIGGRKQVLPPLISIALLLYLAFVSGDVETEHCTKIIVNSTSLGNSTYGYGYGYECEINQHVNIGQMYLNIGLGLLAVVYTFGLFLYNKGGVL